MRRTLLIAALLTVVGLVACGSATRRRSLLDDVDPSTYSDGGDNFGHDAGEAGPCVGLECQRVACGSGTTSVSGTVWDPAGKNPVYNVVVYIPNAPLADIKHGPVCDSCGGAPVSGSPIATTLTDATGAFKLENVPVGDDIPLVIQVGKWRRQITLPTKPNACEDNPITDADLTRLPRNKAEGDMPLIALTGGCDPIHTLVQKIGVDPSEITSANGDGMVRVYAGQVAGGGVANAGVADATDAYAFWGSLDEMMKYDILINECECTPFPRDTKGPAYDNMRQYLDAGGRAFNSHYHLNFLGGSPENGGKNASELQHAANWKLWGGAASFSTQYLIDTSFPKGKAMDAWLTNLTTASKWGPTIKHTPPGQIQTANAGDIADTIPGFSQRWIYPSTGQGAVYVSINTPTSSQPADRCGRVVATDLHVGTPDPTKMSEQEAALEFMFFDLASCVIDDHTAPQPPQVK